MLIGTYKSLVRNAIYGLLHGYKISLMIYGLGYKVSMLDNNIILNIGASHLFNVPVPNAVCASVVNDRELMLTSCDKHAVTSFACKLVHLKKRSSYKKSGIYYKDEIITLKPIIKKKG